MHRLLEHKFFIILLCFTMYVVTTSSYKKGEVMTDKQLDGLLKNKLLRKENIDIFHLFEEEKKDRLQSLIVNSVDSNEDKFVDISELEAWGIKSQWIVEMQNQKFQFAETDSDNDGYVTYSELIEELNGVANHEDNFHFGHHAPEYGDYDLTLFKAADLNSDGKLTIKEYIAAKHPRFSDQTSAVLIRRVLDHFDINKDGCIDIVEVLGDVNLASRDDGNLEEWEVAESDAFFSFDANGDHLLTDIEILEWAGDILQFRAAAEQEVIHAMNLCDGNRDSLLSVAEILSSHNMWVRSSILTNFGKHLFVKSHDEL